MKRIYIISIAIIVVATVSSGYTSMVLAANQSEGAIPHSGDLCGGTGGNGQIISVGNNTFTLKQNDGSNKIIHLTDQATIKTSTGSVSLSDLKVGERVTLVGGPNPDGSFTADTVVVCNGSQKNLTGQKIQSMQKQRADFNKANIWNSYVNISAMLLLGLIWAGTLAFLRLKKKRSLVYLLFFTIFYVYIVKVLDYTLFQFQSLILLKHFAPNIILNGVATGKSLNLIPLISLTLKDVRTSLLNILLMMPFGFGLPFITNFRMKKIVVIGMLFSIAIELTQLITGLMANITFRIADINDVIFNTVGVAIGYMLCVGFLRIFHHIFHKREISANPILRFINERMQRKKEYGTSD